MYFKYQYVTFYCSEFFIFLNFPVIWPTKRIKIQVATGEVQKLVFPVSTKLLSPISTITQPDQGIDAR